jgi:hypothetical protein
VRSRLVAVLVVIVIAVAVVAASWYMFSRPRDADGDGVVDAQDAFPNNPDQTRDTDGDGFGDNPDGNQGDAFPNDASEWMDSDVDGVGDNADVYDQGNGAVRIVIQELVRLDSSLCDGDICDLVFRFGIDVDGSDPFTRVCDGNSTVYPDVEFGLVEPGASMTCDVDERATAVLVEIVVEDDAGTVMDYHPNAGLRYVTTRVEFPPSGYYSIAAMFPYDGPPIQLDWRAAIVGA